MAQPLSKLLAEMESVRREADRLRAELADVAGREEELQTALRVLRSLGIVAGEEEGAETVSGSPLTTEDKKRLVRQGLNTGEANGRAPIEVYKGFGENPAINVDNVRTILWRMAKDPASRVDGVNGRYWIRESDPPEENGAPIGDAEGAPDAGGVAASPVENRSGWRLIG